MLQLQIIPTHSGTRSNPINISTPEFNNRSFRTTTQVVSTEPAIPSNSELTSQHINRFDSMIHIFKHVREQLTDLNGGAVIPENASYEMLLALDTGVPPRSTTSKPTILGSILR